MLPITKLYEASGRLLSFGDCLGILRKTILTSEPGHREVRGAIMTGLAPHDQSEGSRFQSLTRACGWWVENAWWALWLSAPCSFLP